MGEDDFLAAHRRARTKWAIVAAVGVVVLVGGVALLLLIDWRKGPSEEVAKAKDREQKVRTAQAPAEKEPGIEDVEAAIADGCDAESVRRTMKSRRKAGDAQAALAIAAMYEATCGVDGLMRWIVYDTLEELERWDEAAKVAGELIAGKPADVDYWWWRAKALEALDRLDEAAHDYRQSMALSDLTNSSGVHAGGFADLAQKVDQTCDGAFALRYYGAQTDGELTDAATRQIATMVGYGDCQPKVGKGAGELSLRGPVDATIGGQPVRAVVDAHVPYVVVSDALAATIGVDAAAGRAVQIVLLEELRDARLVRADVEAGPLVAEGVDVAVVAAAAGDPEAILGLAFLWRWDVMFDGPVALLTAIEDAGVVSEVAVERFDPDETF